jgi:glycosyltransferase involved in cell wall biosynthesis
MRVLHVTPCYPPTWAYGGIPRVVYALARAQAALGHEVHVWTTDAMSETGRSEMPAVRVENGVTVHVSRLWSNRLAWRHQLYLPQGSVPAVRPDVVHLHSHRHLLNWRAFRMARQAGVPVVHMPHGTAPRLERKQRLKRAWDAAFDGCVPYEADRVVAVSKAEVRQLLALGVPGNRVARIPNPLHLEEFEMLPARGSFRAAWGLGPAPIVAYLGQVTPRKGVDRLVAAFAHGLEGATLVIAGAARGMSLPTGPGVLTTGTLEGRDRLALLVDADVLVYPSTHEVFGLVPLEGLLCGAPAVVGDDCGCGELIHEAGAGLTVGSSTDELRSHIRLLLQDRVRAAAMVERGRAYIAAHLDPRKVAAAHLALYEQL